MSRDRPLRNRVLVILAIAAIDFTLAFILHQSNGNYFLPVISALSIMSAMLMTLYGGLTLGLISSASLVLALDYFIIPPTGSVFDTSMDTSVFFVAVVVGLIVSSFRLAFQKLESTKKELQSAVANRDSMVGIISHELKNPLTALQNGLGLIQRKTQGTGQSNESVISLLGKLNPSVVRMNMLIADLLDVTRLEAKALILNRSPNNLNEIIEEVVKSYEATANEKTIHLEMDLDRKISHADCDPARTAQILANLISNAIKFTEKGGLVRIATKKVGGYAEVQVSDTGKGISDEDLPHVFDRFWQARDGKQMGTGLGLAIAKGLTEAQDGKIWVESQLGVGSAFHFTIPRVQSRLFPKSDFVQRHRGALG